VLVNLAAKSRLRILGSCRAWRLGRAALVVARDLGRPSGRQLGLVHPVARHPVEFGADLDVGRVVELVVRRRTNAPIPSSHMLRRARCLRTALEASDARAATNAAGSS
jgi:hypothetical protein